jgi:two-component system KDP operon response regulator KdpE
MDDTTGSRILVIDDDPDLRWMLKTQLELKGHQVATAVDGRDGLRKAYGAHPDLVILDLVMPHIDGWEVCRRLRDLSAVPIIILTARDREVDIVRGLEIGADDYVTKPFDGAELHARIRALLRRNGNNGDHSGPNRSSYSDSHLSVDFAQRIVKVRGAKVDLSPIEFKLLSCLVRHEGRPLPHGYILTEVWGPEYANEVDYVKLYVRYVRSKIEDDPSKPVHILTEWGFGYRYSGI